MLIFFYSLIDVLRQTKRLNTFKSMNNLKTNEIVVASTMSSLINKKDTSQKSKRNSVNWRGGCCRKKGCFCYYNNTVRDIFFFYEKKVKIKAPPQLWLSFPSSLFVLSVTAHWKVGWLLLSHFCITTKDGRTTPHFHPLQILLLLSTKKMCFMLLARCTNVWHYWFFFLRQSNLQWGLNWRH